MKKSENVVIKKGAYNNKLLLKKSIKWNYFLIIFEVPTPASV